MVLKYVYDARTGGSDNGTTDADAFLTYFQAFPLAAGDQVLVDYRHDEDDANVRTWTCTATPDDPAQAYSVDFDDSYAYRKGARCYADATNDTSDWTLNIDYLETYGLDWRAPDDFVLNETTFYMYDGTWGTRRTTGAELQGSTNPTLITLEEMDIDVNNGGEFFVLDNDNVSQIMWTGGTWVTATTNVFNVNPGVKSLHALIKAINFSLVDNIVNINAATLGTGILEVTLVNCLMKSGFNLLTTAANRMSPGMRIEAYGCDSTVSAGRASTLTYQHEEYSGKSLTVVTHYRTDGSIANGVNYSCRLTALDDLTKKGLPSTAAKIDIRGAFVDLINVDKTFTIYFAHNGVGAGTAGDLETDQIWFDLIGPDNTVVASSQGIFQTLRLAYNATVGDHDNDAVSTWTGSTPSIATHQKMSLTLKPQVAGEYKARVYLAPGNTTGDLDVYIDAKIAVTDT